MTKPPPIFSSHLRSMISRTEAQDIFNKWYSENVYVPHSKSEMKRLIVQTDASLQPNEVKIFPIDQIRRPYHPAEESASASTESHNHNPDKK